MSLKVDGIPRAKGRLERLKKEKPKKFKRGLKKAAEFLLARSQEQVPVDTGALKKSGRVLSRSSPIDTVVSAPMQGDKGFQVVYGNRNVDYAIVVHENLEAFHPIGNAKYVERPAREYRLTMIHIVESEVK